MVKAIKTKDYEALNVKREHRIKERLRNLKKITKYNPTFEQLIAEGMDEYLTSKGV